MRILHDKYILAAIGVIILIVIVSAISTESVSDDGITGIASNVREGENGYTFTLTDTMGDSIRCFTRETVGEGDVCVITGSFSDDGTMFFVSRMTIR